MSNVVLSASIRANLLSLQGTTSLMDKTQLILSTGKKVNSALDNPTSFFAAKSLTDRASDLNSCWTRWARASPASSRPIPA